MLPRRALLSLIHTSSKERKGQKTRDEVFMQSASKIKFHILLPLIFLIIAGYPIAAQSAEPDLEYILGSSDFVSNWRIADNLYEELGEKEAQIERGEEFTTITMTIDEHSSHCDFVSFTGIFSKTQTDPVNLRLQVRADTSELPSDWSAEVNIWERYEWENGGKMEVNNDTQFVWHSISATYNKASLERFYVEISIFILTSSINPSNGQISIQIKNLSSDQNLNRYSLKGLCETCDASDECVTDYYCMGYASADDPFSWLFGKCVPEGTEGDPCGIVTEESSCFLGSSYLQRNYIPINHPNP